MKGPIELYPYILAVETAFQERTKDQELFRDCSKTFEKLMRDEPSRTISRAHLCHAAAITLLRCGHDIASIHDCVFRLDILGDPPMLASALKVAVANVVYPDGDGAHDEWEWQRNVFLQRYALKAGTSFWLECRNAVMREIANAPACRVARLHAGFEYTETPQKPGSKMDDLRDWSCLMESVEAMRVVVTGLAGLSTEQVGWALMALVRYTAGFHTHYDFTKDLKRFRDIVALAAEIELANA